MELRPILSGQILPNRAESGQPQAQLGTTPGLTQTDNAVVLSIAGMVKGLIEKTAQQINEQQFLLNSLPPKLQTSARQIMQSALPDSTALGAGLASLLNCRREASDDLYKLADALYAAAVNKTDDNPELDTALTTLKQSATTVRQLAESVSRAFHTYSGDDGQNILFTLQFPFNAHLNQPQPLHIHIYHDKKKSNADRGMVNSDTWVRLNLQPEYTGSVEVVFHLYGEDILDIKVTFADEHASQLFNDDLSPLREIFREFPFMLKELSVVCNKE